MTPDPRNLDYIYGDLHRIASLHMRRSPAHPTLQPTMLVNEAWLRLSGRGWRSRTHFLALASRAMRHFLVDYLRSKTARKREGAQVRVPLEEGAHAAVRSNLETAVDVEKLLNRLAAEDPRKAKVVAMHFFEGMDFPEIARELDVSVITVKRDWQFCRAWMCSEFCETHTQ